MAETSSGSSMPPIPARSIAKRNRSGPLGERGEGPREGQGEVQVIRRILFVAQPDDRILEGEEHAGVYIERQVQVQRPATALFGVEVDLPDLPERVRLDEMALVVDVEAVVHGVVLEIGHVAGDVDGCHRTASLAVYFEVRTSR